jgi:ribonucleoside-diphosphate reductase subunit M1
MAMGIPYASEEAKELNARIFETIYHGALEASSEIAAIRGPYSTFEGSPASEGILQFDLWEVVPPKTPGSGVCEGAPAYDWDAMKTRICEIGLRNSTLTACMPTASTSQLLGNAESFEPMTANIFSRGTIVGEFVVCNKWLVKYLEEYASNADIEDYRDLFNGLIEANGSVRCMSHLDEGAKKIFQTIWEISNRDTIDMSADRGPYICQSQSLNHHVERPTERALASLDMYAHKKGLKTCVYYVRSRGASEAVPVTIDKPDRKPRTAGDLPMAIQATSTVAYGSATSSIPKTAVEIVGNSGLLCQITKREMKDEACLVCSA